MTLARIATLRFDAIRKELRFTAQSPSADVWFHQPEVFAVIADGLANVGDSKVCVDSVDRTPPSGTQTPSTLAAMLTAKLRIAFPNEIVLVFAPKEIV